MMTPADFLKTMAQKLQQALSERKHLVAKALFGETHKG